MYYTFHLISDSQNTYVVGVSYHGTCLCHYIHKSRNSSPGTCILDFIRCRELHVSDDEILYRSFIFSDDWWKCIPEIPSNSRDHSHGTKPGERMYHITSLCFCYNISNNRGHVTWSNSLWRSRGSIVHSIQTLGFLLSCMLKAPTPSLLQPVMALFRCKPGHKYRHVFHYSHMFVGTSAQILAGMYI